MKLMISFVKHNDASNTSSKCFRSSVRINCKIRGALEYIWKIPIHPLQLSNFQIGELVKYSEKVIIS